MKIPYVTIPGSPIDGSTWHVTVFHNEDGRVGLGLTFETKDAKFCSSRAVSYEQTKAILDLIQRP